MSSQKAVRPSISAIALAILVALFAALSFAGSADAARTVLSAGHVDGINPVLEGGALRITVRDDTNPPDDVVREVDDVLIHATPTHRRAIPGSGYYDFGFLDHPSGMFWHLPSNNQVDKLFLGWGAESPTLREGGASKFEGPLQYSLVDYEGPGYFYLYQLGDEAVDILASGEPMTGVTNRWTEPIPTHVHANWAFSEPGLHKLSFRVSGTLIGGQTVSDTQEYRFFVDAPTGIDAADLPDLEVTGLTDRHEIGSQATLTAGQSPATGLDHYHWFKRCDAGVWQYIDPSLSDTIELTVTEDLLGCEIQARLYDDEHVVVATSTPDTLKSTQPTLTITGLEDHYHAGDRLELGLRFDPPEDHPHVHWHQRAAGGGEWAEIGNGVTLSKELTLADDGSEVKAVQGHGDEGYESAPVTVRVEDHGGGHHGEPKRLRATLKPMGPKRFRQLRRQKALKVRLGTNAAGRTVIRASIAPRAARRIGLKVGRKARRVIVGAAQVRRRAAGQGVATVRIKPRVLRKLSRARGALRVRMVAQVRGEDGQRVVRRAAMRLRR